MGFDVIIRLVDIDGIVYHHYLSLFSIIPHNAIYMGHQWTKRQSNYYTHTFDNEDIWKLEICHLNNLTTIKVNRRLMFDIKIFWQIIPHIYILFQCYNANWPWRSGICLLNCNVRVPQAKFVCNKQYSQTCIKMSHLGKRKSGLIRQVTS